MENSDFLRYKKLWMLSIFFLSIPALLKIKDMIHAGSVGKFSSFEVVWYVSAIFHLIGLFIFFNKPAKFLKFSRLGSGMICWIPLFLLLSIQIENYSVTADFLKSVENFFLLGAVLVYSVLIIHINRIPRISLSPRDEVPRSLFWLFPVIFFPICFLWGWMVFDIRYMADDFCRLTECTHISCISTQYMTWSGRFSASFFHLLRSSRTLFGEQLVTLFLISLFVFLLYQIMGIVIRTKSIRSKMYIEQIILAAYTFISVFLLTPSLNQSVYWFTGRDEYFLPLVFFTAYFLLIYYCDKVPKKILIPGLILLAIFLGGWGVVSGIMIFACQLATLLVLHFGSDRRFGYLLIGFSIFCVSFILMLIAPGNYIRQSNHPNPDILLSIIKSVIYTWPYLILKIFNPLQTIFVILTAFLFGYYGFIPYSEYIVKKGKSILQISFVFLVVCVLTVSLSGFLAQSRMLPDRSWTICGFFITLLIIFAASLGGCSLSRAFVIHPSILRSIIIVVVVCALLLSARFTFMKIEVSKFALDWDERNTYLMSVEPDEYTTVSVPIFSSEYYAEDISEDPNSWVNHCLASYYQLNSIRGFSHFAQ